MYGFGTSSEGEPCGAILAPSVRRLHLFLIFGLSIVGLLLVVEAAVMLHTLTHDMSVRAILIGGTGRLPELTMSDGYKYHLFLSRPCSIATELDSTVLTARRQRTDTTAREDTSPHPNSPDRLG
eukprot:4698051-Prymnesium_polylepis.1